MMTNLSLRRRRIMQGVSDRVEAPQRLVDIGVQLFVIRRDPAGQELIPGSKLRHIIVGGPFAWGGVLDTETRKLIGPSQDPRRWYCSEEQLPIIMHPDSAPRAQLVEAGEGTGKTTALAMWHHKRWCENLGEFREGGQTAPVLKRLGLVRIELEKHWRPNWYRWVDRDDFTGYELPDGSRIRFCHTHRQSQAQGSPIQGFNWSWAGRDEMQDQVDVHFDIESRGRAARNGGEYYKQLGTATAKDDSEWRNLKGELKQGGAWMFHRLDIRNSPFVGPDFLAAKRASGVTDREFRRRWLGEDLPPESRVYFTWDRSQNLRPVPRVGARLITQLVLKAKTGNPRHSLLVGHDPGTAKAASIILEAYEFPKEHNVLWWVRAELFTLHQTSEQHAREVLKLVQRFGCNKPGTDAIALVRAQPVGQSEDKPDENTYRVWKRVGFDIKAAQYKKDGTGTGQIKKDSRIEMITTLLCDAMGKRRLFIDVDDQGRPVAPKLVEAFETMERDAKGRAEHEAKDEDDPSDCPAALGYALWPFEKEAAASVRDAVQREVRRA